MASLACSDGSGCLPSQPTESPQQGTCNQATLWGNFLRRLHCQTFAYIRDPLHFPDAPCNSKQRLCASPLTHLAEKMKSSGAAARAGEIELLAGGISAAAASATHQHHPDLLQVPRAAPARQMCRAQERHSLWPKVKWERGKNTQEDEGSRQLVTTLVAQPAFLCQIPWASSMNLFGT